MWDARDGAWYDTALICRKGHTVNSDARSSPERNAAFCSECGAPTISACPACRAEIRGWYHVPGVVSLGGTYAVPGHCHACGKPYPWTDARHRALSELLAMSDAPVEDQAALRDSLPALAADSPETPVAVAKWKRFLSGAGKQLAGSFRELLVQICAEAVNRRIFGG